MADRYWVGGSAAWDATAGTKWASTSGGAGGQAVPTATDDVYFNGSSGSGTITINTTVNCRILNCTGFTGTLTHSSASGIISIGATGGTLTLGAGMTYNATVGTINFLSTTDNSTAGWPITTAGKSLPAVNFNGVAGKWTLQDAFTALQVTLTAGELASNNKNITATNSTGFIGSGASGKTLTLGSSTLTTTRFSYGDGTALISGGTIICSSGFSSASTTLNDIILRNDATSGSLLSLNGVFTCVNLTLEPAVVGYAGMIQLGNSTSSAPTITGTFTVNGTPGKRYMVMSAAAPTARTITAANVSLSYAVFMDITGAGAATWSGTELGDGGGNSGITFTPSQTNYWVGGTGSWSDAAHWASTSGGVGGTGRVPTVHDDVVLDAASGSGTISLDCWGIGRNLDMSDSTVSVTAVSITISGSVAPMFGLWGSIELPTGSAVFNSGVSTNTLFFMKRDGAAGITSNGKTLNLAGAVGLGLINATLPLRLAFNDDVSLGGTFTMRNGAAVDNSGNHNLTTTGSFSGSQGSPTNLNNWGNGTYIFQGTTGGISSSSANTVVTSPTLRYTNVGTSNLSVSTGVYPNIIIENGILAAGVSSPIKSLTVRAGATLRLSNNSMNVATLNCNGTSLSVATIISSSNTVARTLTVTTAANVRYTSIRDSTAAGAAAPLTAYNSNNVSNNTNWNFVTTSFAPASSFFEVL